MGGRLTPKVVIDGYTVSSTLNSPATLSLGTTLILVCRLSGIPHGQQTNYTWTCPNTPCQQTGYAGRKINNNIIAINTTSTSDGGTYTCTVTAGGVEASQQFQLNVAGKCMRVLKKNAQCMAIISHTTGGAVVHSYGRLIFHERVITNRHQLQPLNNNKGDGMIECVLNSGHAAFYYGGVLVSTNTSGDIFMRKDGPIATVSIKRKTLKNFKNMEGECTTENRKPWHYLFLSSSKSGEKL